MNQGKRYIRNTVLAVFGVTALVIIAERILASVDANTPQWLRNVLSMGLEVARPEPEAKAPQVMNLSDVREFSRLEVEEMFAVEIIGAPHYKAGIVPAPDKPWTFHVEWSAGGLLRVKGGPDAAGAVLRIEAPTLTSIDLQGVEELKVRGELQAPEVSLRMKGLKRVEILESKVGVWKMDAVTPTEVWMGNNPSSYTHLKLTGKSTVSYTPGKKEVRRP